MGAINYGTSDYITMGIVPYSRYELEEDAVFMDELRREVAEYGGDIDEALSDYINICEEEDYLNAESIIEKYDIHY